MTPAGYSRAVRAAADALATGELEWDEHYVRLRQLHAAYVREHGAGWPQIVQTAYRGNVGDVAS